MPPQTHKQPRGEIREEVREERKELTCAMKSNAALGLNLIGCPLFTNLVCCDQSFLFLGGLLADGVPHLIHLLQLLLDD